MGAKFYFFQPPFFGMCEQYFWRGVGGGGHFFVLESFHETSVKKQVTSIFYLYQKYVFKTCLYLHITNNASNRVLLLDVLS